MQERKAMSLPLEWSRRVSSGLTWLYLTWMKSLAGDKYSSLFVGLSVTNKFNDLNVI
jgi:hypothetical protein